jgi:hypothetical protein
MSSSLEIGCLYFYHNIVDNSTINTYPPRPIILRHK